MTAALWRELEPGDFTHPWYRHIFEQTQAHGALGLTTAESLLEVVRDDDIRSAVSALSVEPLQMTGDPNSHVASAYVVRLRELTALRRIQQIKSKLQRMNPVTEQTDYNRLFGELVALESHRRSLRERAIGSTI